MAGDLPLSAGLPGPSEAGAGRPRDAQADYVIGFHLQQTVEKALKSVLANHAIEIPRTHDLGYLVELLSDIDLEIPEQVASSDWLTPWGVLFRYDDNPNDSLDRDKALEASAAAIAFAEVA
jgi:HEPN domain-containing protein